MTSAEIRAEVLDILSDIAPDEDLSGIVDDKPFREQLELDSMDFLDIVMELRKRHKIQVPEEDYKELASLGSTVRYLEPKMKDVVKAAGCMSSGDLIEAVSEKVHEILSSATARAKGNGRSTVRPYDL